MFQITILYRIILFNSIIINIYAKNHSNDLKNYCISLHIIKLQLKPAIKKQKQLVFFTNHSSVIFKSFTAVMMYQ